MHKSQGFVPKDEFEKSGCPLPDVGRRRRWWWWMRGVECGV
jgi:hypothetical protein